MSTLLLVLTGLALAQDPDSDGASVVDDDDAYEIIVYDDVAAEFARQAVVERLDEIGYSERIERNGYVIYRHPDNWRGDVRMYDEGYIRIRRQPVQVEPVFGKAGTPLGTASCVLLLPLCTRLGGQTVGRRKLQAQKTGIAQFLDPEMDVWGDRIADREVGSRIAVLPDELEKLWFEGVPLEGGEEAVAVVGPDAKKAAILAFWDSRTNTIWGNRVRLTVEGFIRAVVQNSEQGFSNDEVAAFNTTRTSERQLDLTSPWETVAEGL